MTTKELPVQRLRTMASDLDSRINDLQDSYARALVEKARLILALAVHELACEDLSVVSVSVMDYSDETEFGGPFDVMLISAQDADGNEIDNETTHDLSDLASAEIYGYADLAPLTDNPAAATLSNEKAPLSVIACRAYLVDVLKGQRAAADQENGQP